MHPYGPTRIGVKGGRISRRLRQATQTIEGGAMSEDQNSNTAPGGGGAEVNVGTGSTSTADQSDATLTPVIGDVGRPRRIGEGRRKL